MYTFRAKLLKKILSSKFMSLCLFVFSLLAQISLAIGIKTAGGIFMPGRASCKPSLIFSPSYPLYPSPWTHLRSSSTPPTLYMASYPNSDHPPNLTNPGRGLSLFLLIYVLCIDSEPNLLKFDPKV